MKRTSSDPAAQGARTGTTRAPSGKRGRVLPALLLAASLGALPGLARAEPSASDVAQARAQFNEGVNLRDKGDAAGALEPLKQANALAHTPITGLELGKTYLALGKLIEARETFLAVARSVPQPQETSRSAGARQESAKLAEQVRTRIANLRIHVTGVPLDGVSVTLDGARVPVEALAASRLVNPGAHVVTAQAASGASVEKRLDMKESETRDVELALVAVAAAAPVAVAPLVSPPAASEPLPEPSPLPARANPLRRPLIYGGFGLAAVGLGVGAVTGVMALSKASTAKDACQGNLCPTSADADITSGLTLGTVSTIAFVAGGVGVAAGVVGLLLPRFAQTPSSAASASSSERVTSWVAPWITPTSAGLSGAF